MMAQAIEFQSALADRFTKTFAAFVAAVEDAVDVAGLNPEFADAPQLQVWQRQALPLLQQQNSSIQNAMALFQVGETRSLVAQAAERLHLARELDGCDLNFAGADRGKILDQLETAVVVAAYRLCTEAGVS